MGWHTGRKTCVAPVEYHADDRGSLAVVANKQSFGHQIGAVAVLISKAGTVRAEHRHRNEGHIVYLVSGAMEYRERLLDKKVVTIRVLPGEGIFTPPNADHAFLFTEDSVAVVVANISRTQEEYESDVTRLVGSERLFKESTT